MESKNEAYNFCISRNSLDEVVYRHEGKRSKKELEKLPGIPCFECEKWVISFLMDEETRAGMEKTMSRFRRMCKHKNTAGVTKHGKVVYHRPVTPPDFWNMSFEAPKRLR